MSAKREWFPMYSVPRDGTPFRMLMPNGYVLEVNGIGEDFPLREDALMWQPATTPTPTPDVAEVVRRIKEKLNEDKRYREDTLIKYYRFRDLCAGLLEYLTPPNTGTETPPHD